MKLNNVASVYSGLSFREKIIHDPQGEVGVIQLRNLTHGYSVIESEIDRIVDTGIKRKYFLAEGDILVASKGGNNHAVRVNSGVKKAAASASFFIIKIKTNKVNSKYLHWFLNSSLAQNELKKQQSGTYTPTLKIAALQELDIPLPLISVQTNIGKLYQLQLREESLQNQLIEKRQILIDNLLISAL